jgi:hypothetical protein
MLLDDGKKSHRNAIANKKRSATTMRQLVLAYVKNS